MRKAGIILVAAMITAVFAGTSLAEGLRVAVIDMNKILNDSEAGKEAKKKMEARYEELKKTIDVKQEEARKIKEEIDKQKVMLGKEKLKEREDALQAKINELRQLTQEGEQEMQTRQAELTREVLKSVEAKVAVVVKADKLDLVLEKSVAVVIGCIVAAIAVWILAIAGAAASASDLPWDKLAAALAMLVLLGLAFGAIALAVSAGTGNRGAAIGLAVGLMVAMYLVDALAAIVDSLAVIRPLSLFRYYMGGDPLRNGISIPDAGVLAAVAVAFVALALVLFERRDLAA